MGIGALLLLIGFLSLTPTGCYLSRGAYEEAKILKGRRDIEKLVGDASVDSVTRTKLRLVLDARTFAIDSLQFNPKKSFTTYSKLEHDTLVLVLSAAYRDKLEPYTWWFPIVGRVPYKGYFDFGKARADAKSLAGEGYDVYLRPSSAFSTLGFFNDPLLSTTLKEDSLDLANTVIHELTHNTFYASGQAVFNESFANFVGARGAAWLFRARGSPRAAEQTDDRWQDEKILAVFWDRLYKTLDSAYKAHPSDKSARLAARDTVYDRARLQLVYEVGPSLRTIGPRYFERVRLDNAALLARRIYLTDLDLFDQVWLRQGRDLRKTVAQVVALAKSEPKDPYGALRTWLASVAKPPAQ